MEPNHIFDIFLSLQNPALYALIFLIVVLILVLLIKREFIHPLAVRKRKLELENAKLTALYSEVDPDPIIRINNSWNVIDMNNAAKIIFENENQSIKNILDELKENLNDQRKHIVKINDNYYSSTIKEIEELEFKHIYLHDITQRKSYEEKIKNYQENLKMLRTKVDTVNEEEKKKIGGELHDSVGHSISLLKIDLQNIIEKEQIVKDKNAFKGLFNSLDELALEVRDISHELKPPILNEFGLLHAIQSLVDKINTKTDIQGYVTYNTEFRIEYQDIEVQIYRICQEAFTNIEKHSYCTEFNIDFYFLNKLLQISISDNGNGFDLETNYEKKSPSLGLLNMKERAESVGGTFEIDSIINMGTSINLEFNFNEK
ncbi:MAG: histidine kinase [Melioribacteraceae bacterium]